MRQATRVLLAYDDDLFRDGLVEFLESHPAITVVSRCGDGREAFWQAKAKRPDLAMAKICLPGCDGFGATKQITESRPNSSVVVLTESEEEGAIVSAMKAGATGYVPRDTGRDDLVNSVELPGNNDQSPGRLEGLWSTELKYSVEMERMSEQSTD
jgi:DNA-binding NarL/FixJ family response regulator